MQYRNKITGNIINVPTEIKGKNWEKVTAKAEAKPAKAVPEAQNEPESEEKPIPKENLKEVRKNECIRNYSGYDRII